MLSLGLMKPFFSRKSKYLTIYRPPNESSFLEIINPNFDKLASDTKESYIVCDFKT